MSSDRQNANDAYRIHTERYVQMTCSNTSMVTKPFHAMMTSTRERFTYQTVCASAVMLHTRSLLGFCFIFYNRLLPAARATRSRVIKRRSRVKESYESHNIVNEPIDAIDTIDANSRHCKYDNLSATPEMPGNNEVHAFLRHSL